MRPDERAVHLHPPRVPAGPRSRYKQPPLAGTADGKIPSAIRQQGGNSDERFPSPPFSEPPRYPSSPMFVSFADRRSPRTSLNRQLAADAVTCHTRKPMPKWFLRSIAVTGGFLPGLAVEFPRGLTCIIGPRGSGKSTLAEALRYGIGGPSRASNGALVQANLGASVVTIVTSPEAAELGYTIRRSYKQPAALLTSEGRSIESLDLGSRKRIRNFDVRC